LQSRCFALILGNTAFPWYRKARSSTRPTSNAFQQQTAERFGNLSFDAPFQGFVPFERADALPAVDARIGVPARSQINPGVVRTELIAIDVNLVD